MNFGRKSKDDSLDNFSEIDGCANLYDSCVKMKLKGASNSELKIFLKENGISEAESKEMVRQIDSDYLSGLLRNPERSNFFVSQIGGIIALFIGIAGIVFQLYIGIISIWLTLIFIGLISTGMAMIARGNMKKVRRQTENIRSKSQFNSWKKKI